MVAIPTIFAAFMFVLDETVANVALPHMAGTFSATRDESMWIITFYLVASGVSIPTVDFFCKMVGRKNYFMLCTLVFTISSFLCGLAKSLDMMVFMRIIQGFAGGGLLPISQAILLEAFPKEARGKAMAVFGLVVVVAPIIGPVVGGWITDNWTWSWIFFINIPIGIFTLYISKLFLEDPPYAQKQKGVKIDNIGFLLLLIWLVTLQIMLDKGNNKDWFNSPFIMKMGITSLISGVSFFWWQLKAKNPLINLKVFRDKNFTIGTFVQVIIMGVLMASLVLLPQFLQNLMGYTALLSGLTIIPRGCGALISLVFCGYLSTKVDNRILAVIGLLFIGVAGTALGFLNLQISNINVAIPNFLFGVGMGFAMIPLVSLSVITLKNEQMTNASGIQNLVKNIGGAIGTSLAATFISRFSQIHQHYMVGNLNPLNPVFQAKFAATKGAIMQYTDPVSASYLAQYSLYGQMLKQSTLWGFMETFRIFGILAILIIPLLFFIKKTGTDEKTKKS